MRAEQSTPIFSPITISLTFDTKEEYNAFQLLISYDQRIPQALELLDTRTNAKLLGDIFQTIHVIMPTL
jgi:hypothetical protein